MEQFIKKEAKTCCCHSYLTPKGRCFDCVAKEWTDPDEEVLS